MNKFFEIIRNSDFTAWNIVFLVMWVFLLVSCFSFVYLLIKYLKDYRIFEIIYAKIKGDIVHYDRVRRSQMKTAVENTRDIYATKKRKIGIVDSLYLAISKTGITEVVPGFSEMAFIFLIGSLAVILFVSTFLLKGALLAVVFSVAYFVIVAYTLSLIAYTRKVKLEKQLLQFTNACASASLQYSNIVDILGAVYPQFSYPLREGLEACYVEAKSTSDEELALAHLKERYDSTQFSFIIDNFTMCSQATGDYYSVARDIAIPVSIYSEAFTKRQAKLKNAKAMILLMFGVSLGILWSLDAFVGGIIPVMLNTAIGNIVGIGMILVLFYGLNMKAE